MLRGLCALGVVVSHVRSLLLVHFGETGRHAFGDMVLFTLGGLGHECVIVFFVLSGYLVGGSTLAAMRAGRFSWLDYGAARLSRLWTVLLPALVLTALLDFVGAALAHAGSYAGVFYAKISSGPTLAAPVDHSLATFIGNLFFLQTIETPVFGTNAPLWSLSNEAWYYVAFPLLAIGFFRRERAVFAAPALLLLALLPGEMTVLGLPWLAGALAAHLPVRRAPMRAMLVSLATAAMIGLAHRSRPYGGGVVLTADVALGCVVALWLRHLAVFAPIGGIYAHVAAGLSKISYTLYAVHFPLMLLLWFWLLAPEQSEPGLAALGRMAVFVAVALVYATGVWFLFERRTEAVRGWMKRLLGLRSRDARQAL
jgi:peptidoglycan/LPS O-acetylase OafA/YrhL